MPTAFSNKVQIHWRSYELGHLGLSLIMTTDEILSALEDILYRFHGKHLTNVQKMILQGSSANKTYEMIAMENAYSMQYIRHEGYKLWNLLSKSLDERVSKQNFQTILKRWVINNNQNSQEGSYERNQERNSQQVVRSIEFPPDCWEAGTSILTYFSHILKVKYPDKKIKVRIEQEDLLLRMIIDTPTGEREEIEKTLEEYGMVVMGKIQPEIFLSNPFDVMALKNKLEIADLDLRQARMLLDFTKDNSQQRIESLEVQVNKLHHIIEKGLQSGNHVFEVISKMTEQDKSTYNFSNAKFGGGFATENGFQVGGNLTDLSSASNLTDAVQQIQVLLQQLYEQGFSSEDARQQAASDLAKQAEANPTVMEKLVKWGQSLADTAGKTTVSEAAKGVVKLALQLSGMSLP